MAQLREFTLTSRTPKGSVCPDAESFCHKFVHAKMKIIISCPLM